MNVTTLHRSTYADQAYDAAQEELLPWGWSVAVWVALASASWGAVYLVSSLFL
jgi:hypothetical protein